jgi:hypothetical protein
MACLEHRKNQLRESDILRTALDGMGVNRTDDERKAQGS